VGLESTKQSKILKKMDSNNENKPMNPTLDKGVVSGWVNAADKLPDALQTVWLTNGKGWVCLGCLIEDL
jgi:hypothetical protein